MDIGRLRQVPLSEVAIEQLNQVPRDTERPFPVTEVAMRQVWDRLGRRLGLDGLTFHNLRNEATSRVFDNGIKIHEMIAISGHRGLASFSGMCKHYKPSQKWPLRQERWKG